MVVKGKKVSNRTINIDLIYLSQCFSKAVEWGYIESNSCKKVKKLKENKNRIQYFSDEEISKLISTANPYIKRFLIVGLYTGLRLNELLNLKISNVDILSGIIHVENTDTFSTKNGKNRDIPISSSLSVYLQVFLKTWVHPRTNQVHARTFNQIEYFAVAAS